MTGKPARIRTASEQGRGGPLSQGGERPASHLGWKGEGKWKWNRSRNISTEILMLPAAIAKGRTATLDEVADWLGVKTRVVRNVVKKHAVPALDTGAQLRFDELAFNALLEALRCRSMSSAARVAAPYRSPALSRSRMAGGSRYDAVLARIDSDLQQRKRRRSKPRSSGTPGMANGGAVVPMRKP